MRGCNIELGYALREQEERELKIVIAHEEENPSLFYKYQKIELVNSVKEAMELF